MEIVGSIQKTSSTVRLLYLAY